MCKTKLKCSSTRNVVFTDTFNVCGYLYNENYMILFVNEFLKYYFNNVRMMFAVDSLQAVAKITNENWAFCFVETGEKANNSF